MVIVPTNMTLDSLMYATSFPGISPTPRSVVAKKEELWKRACAVRKKYNKVKKDCEVIGVI